MSKFCSVPGVNSILASHLVVVALYTRTIPSCNVPILTSVIPASVPVPPAVYVEGTLTTLSVADGTLAPLDIDDVRYIRVTNLDDTTSVTLSLQSDVGEDDSAADESASLLLEAGKSFMMGVPNDGIGISDANANLVTDLVYLESLVVFTGSDAIDVEIFIASV